jgi:hypothetical protein
MHHSCNRQNPFPKADSLVRVLVLTLALIFGQEANALIVMPPSSIVLIQYQYRPGTGSQQLITTAQYGAAATTEFTSTNGLSHIFQTAGGYTAPVPVLRTSNLSSGNYFFAPTTMSSSLEYYVGLEVDDPIYAGMPVPVIMNYTMSIVQEVSRTGTYGFQTVASAYVDFGIVKSEIFMNNLNNEMVRDKIVSRSGVLTRTIDAGLAFPVRLRTTTDATFAGLMTSFVDPYFEIDPSFALASHFRLVFSDGAGNLPVPEPTSALMIGTGIFILAAVCSRRRRSVNNERRGEA